MKAPRGLHGSVARSLGDTWRVEPGNVEDGKRNRHITGEQGEQQRHDVWKPSNQQCPHLLTCQHAQPAVLATQGSWDLYRRLGVVSAALVLSCAWCAHAAPSPQDTLFVPGTVPYDTAGHKVRAHSCLVAATPIARCTAGTARQPPLSCATTHCATCAQVEAHGGGITYVNGLYYWVGGAFLRSACFVNTLLLLPWALVVFALKPQILGSNAIVAKPWLGAGGGRGRKVQCGYHLEGHQLVLLARPGDLEV